MGERDINELETGLAAALSRADLPAPTNLTRLTGGATMESWRFEADGEAFILRRSPSAEFMAERPFGHAVEAAVIRAAHAGGVTAPQVVVELEDSDGIGSGFVMRALPGTPDPSAILEMKDPDALLREAARDLARIHALDPSTLPPGVPEMDYRQAIENLADQFEEAGGDRPIIALGLKWLRDHAPERIKPVLNHGDYRIGNLLAEDSRLTGVLDWELAHFGDPHEDLAFGCMTVWRFMRPDRPGLGLGSLDDWFGAYEAESGRIADRDRFRFWLVYRTVWWALGCLRMGGTWRSGADRSLERAIISRRTSEQELDLLLLLETEAPEEERARPLPPSSQSPAAQGEASAGELATAIAEWLVTVKDRMEGHDRFQHAVARNALGIIARDYAARHDPTDRDLAQAFLAGQRSFDEPELLAGLRRSALDKLSLDMPKYPALGIARSQWTGEN